MRFVIDFVYLLAALAYSPKVLYRAIRYKRYRSGWRQRFGKITRKSPEKKCIWLHAVSVGEVNAARTIVKELEERFGGLIAENAENAEKELDIKLKTKNCKLNSANSASSAVKGGFEIVISTTTDTGYARAGALFGERLQVFYFPFDFSWIMQRAFRNIRPVICLLMELEVWPNFVQIAQKLNIPVVVVNGRISDKSFSGYKKIKPIAKTIFQKLNLVLAQTQEYAQRFKEIGCPDERVVVTGSLKYDTAQITDKVEGADELAKQLNIGDERLWVAGGTGPGEEKIILNVFKSLNQEERFGDLRLVIVPRKPERFDEVAGLIKQTGFELIRYSQVKNQATGASSIEHRVSSIEAVILGDTMGDLRKFYSLATLVFVGRSLVPMGGSDMMEAAALGKCTLFGPYTFNFKHTVDELLADKGAVMVKDEQELLDAMIKCLADTDFAERIARSGREVIRKNQGATVKTIDQIVRLLI